MGFDFMLGQNELGQLLIYVLLLMLCVYLAWTDLCDRRIPNRVLLLGLMLTTLVTTVLFPSYPWFLRIVSGAVLTILFVSLSLFWPAAFGMGDAKLLGLLGYALGFRAFAFVLTAASLAALVTTLYLLFFSRARSGSTLPFAPFVAVGMLLLLLSFLLDFFYENY
ncbi:prepilin peptidase [Brevibacillus sp. NRS-1366]|uniref:prepilin peptidase n=1 Tax=Brevibacillus sp. NRS-1366 TaxID=3233899 RepID=UPI003D1AC7F2